MFIRGVFSVGCACCVVMDSLVLHEGFLTLEVEKDS